MKAALGPLTAALVVVIATATAAPAAGQEGGGDAERGRALAKKWCSSCHLVGTYGTAADDAPPFPAVANDPAKPPAYLRVWLAAPHGAMPDLDLTRQEIEDLVAYITSLKRR